MVINMVLYFIYDTNCEHLVKTCVSDEDLERFVKRTSGGKFYHIFKDIATVCNGKIVDNK